MTEGAAAPEELSEGLFRIALPLDGHPLGYVNVYVLGSTDGVLLVDCGWSTPETQTVLTRALACLGHGPDGVRLVLATHAHADHSGLAGWLQRCSAVVGMHPDDSVQLSERYGDSKEQLATTRQWLVWAGVPEDLRRDAERHIGAQSATFISVEPDLSPGDGERILHGRFDLAIIHTPGYTPGSVCLHDQTTGTLFTGDTLFARSMYSPTLRPFSSPDPMTEYLTSIDSLSRLQVTVGLPGHGDPIHNVPARCASAAAHHLNRAAEVARLVDTGSTAWAVAARLPRRRAWDMLGMGPRLSAIGEVSAHLVRLQRQGHVAEVADGATAVWRAT